MCIHISYFVLEVCFDATIAVSIRDVFKEALKAELGRYWTQLAEEMGVARTHIDDLQERTDISLLQKINAFLLKYPFPAFRSDADTKEFLVEVLERVCLTNIAAAVRKNLEYAIPSEGTYFLYAPLCYLFIA